ncbi:MAG TPA: hypothetical protein DEQ74_02515 [Wolbachia sp.]|jgi:hypothetical protein|nr:hypothetical protein [Wolbachia sp.]
MVVLSIVLFVFVFLLNTTAKLSVCSLMFVLSALVTNVITDLYGKRNATNILLVCIAISIALMWQNLSFMLVASFISLFISLHFSMSTLEALQPIFKRQFHIENFTALFNCSLIDSSIIAISLMKQTSFSNALIVGLKDFIFKMSYTSVICFVLLAVFGFLRQRKYHLRSNKLIAFIINH